MPRRIGWILGMLALGCGRAEEPAQQPEAAVASPLAGAAGGWQVTAFNEAGDSVVSYHIVATADTAGWVLHLPGREPVALRVRVEGDSVITEAGPFESVLRAGLQVTTRAATRISGDSMMGTTVARYRIGNADSVATLRIVGVRSPGR